MRILTILSNLILLNNVVADITILKSGDLIPLINSAAVPLKITMLMYLTIRKTNFSCPNYTKVLLSLLA